MRVSNCCLGVMAALLLLAGCVSSTGPEERTPGPSARITVGSATAGPGDTVEIPITLDILDPEGPPWDSLSHFWLAVQYKDTIISFLDARAGEAVSSWEVIQALEEQYRPRRGYPRLDLRGTRVVRNDITDKPTQHRPAGVLFYLRFEVAASLSPPGDSAAVSFYSSECYHNAMMSLSGNPEFYMQYHDASEPSFTPLYDTMLCERRYRLFPVIEFVSGQIDIEAPYGPDRADLNLNGIPFEFADAMMFADYLDRGIAALSGNPQKQARQIQAGDINGDGEPLTQADYEEMIRIGGAPFTIRMGDATMRAGDTIALPLTLTFLDKNHTWNKHFGGFHFLVSHDNDHLEFLQAEQGSAIAEWEYFTYRMNLRPNSECGNCRVERVLALRDMNDGIPVGPVTEFQEGIFANLLYTTVSPALSMPVTTRVSFYSQDCWDNSLFSLDGNTCFTAIGFAGDLVQDPEFDTTGCSSHHYTSLNVTTCASGTVTIEE